MADAISDIEIGKNERKTNIYISLYGVSSIEALLTLDALDAIQNPMSLYEPVYTEGGDTLYVMDQISDKKWRTTG